jgi:hypothetical protein
MIAAFAFGVVFSAMICFEWGYHRGHAAADRFNRIIR